MYTILSPYDKDSYAEFRCVLDAQLYADVAKDSLPPYARLVIVNTNPAFSCKGDCVDCVGRIFSERSVH